MTKRQFNAIHKRNYGQQMPSDTRESYRHTMHRPDGDWVMSETRNMFVRRPDQLARKLELLPGALLKPSPLRCGLSYRLLGYVLH